MVLWLEAGPQLSEHWRPDRCGILVCFVGEGEGIPPEFPQLGLKFDIVDSPRVLAWDPLIKFIGSEIANHRPVFLGTPAPIGYERRKIFLNYAMADAVRLRHRPLMLERLEAAYQLGMRDACIEKTVFTWTPGANKPTLFVIRLVLDSNVRIARPRLTSGCPSDTQERTSNLPSPRS